MTAPTTTRPATQGEGETGRVYLLQVARDLGFLSGTGYWTWDRLLDKATDAYWTHRPTITERCGSNPGYRLHLLRHEPACQPCRHAHALVKAIVRRRIERGVHPYPPRRPLQPCGTHAAFNRHKANGERPCPACEAAETAYQAARPGRKAA